MQSENNKTGKPWQHCERFVEIRSHWLTLIGEHLQDEQGKILEYWRVEKADSAIILPIQNQQLILPPPTYRPGLQAVTLDFPGGRVPPREHPSTAVPIILQRELGIAQEGIVQITPLNAQGWAVNSSFSNQQVYGFVADLQPSINIPQDKIGATYPTNLAGIQSLLDSLTCLQCRAVLLEWWLNLSPLGRD
jgi:hypothetical protein